MHPPREISASPEEIARAPLPTFLALLGKEDLLIGGKHARKQITKHLKPQENARIGLTMPIDSDLLKEVEVAAAPWADNSLNALALHHLALEPDFPNPLVKALKALKPGGRIVLHDLVWRQEPPETLAAQAREIWQMPLAPKTVAALWARLEELGVTDLSLDLGAFAWFRAKQFARDESKYAADILFNALNHPASRKRYLAALDHFRENDRFYGYVVLSGVKGGA